MELSPKRALIPGSFDPITLGHVDIITRAAKIFDHVTVVVMTNSEKKTMFTPEERLSFVRAAVSDTGFDNISVMLGEGLTSDAAYSAGAATLIKGARGTVDFDYELMLMSVMRDFDERFDSLVFPAKAELAHVSSTYARELIKYGAQLERAIPTAVIPLIKEARK